MIVAGRSRTGRALGEIARGMKRHGAATCRRARQPSISPQHSRGKAARACFRDLRRASGARQQPSFISPPGLDLARPDGRSRVSRCRSPRPWRSRRAGSACPAGCRMADDARARRQVKMVDRPAPAAWRLACRQTISITAPTTSAISARMIRLDRIMTATLAACQAGLVLGSGTACRTRNPLVTDHAHARAGDDQPGWRLDRFLAAALPDLPLAAPAIARAKARSRCDGRDDKRRQPPGQTGRDL